MDLAPVGSNNYANRGCNYLVITPLNTYQIIINLCKILMKSVDYVPKITAWDFIHTIPVVCILASHLLWAVRYGCSLYIHPHVANILVWTSAVTAIVIIISMYIHKTRYSCCNHWLIFSCVPTEIIFLFLLSVSVILLSMARFLSYLCCISYE